MKNKPCDFCQTPGHGPAAVANTPFIAARSLPVSLGEAKPVDGLAFGGYARVLGVQA